MKSNPLIGSPCLTPRVIENSRLSSCTVTLATCFTYSLCKTSMYCAATPCSSSALQSGACSTESKAFSKSMRPTKRSAECSLHPSCRQCQCEQMIIRTVMRP
eukprot:1955371-Karenia_brevis.AAC.1